MDALGLSQRCGDGGKGIGGKCLYRKYLHLMNQVGMVGGGFFFSNANREAFSLFFFVRDFFFGATLPLFFLKFAIPGTIVANSPIETN